MGNDSIELLFSFSSSEEKKQFLELVRSASYVRVEYAGLDLTMPLHLYKQTVVARLGKAIGKRNFIRKRMHGAAVHGHSEILLRNRE